MSTYTLSNKTDLRDRPIVTHNLRKAQRIWNKIKPGPGAGNRYAASFTVACERCGAAQSMTVEYITCDCCQRCGRAPHAGSCER